MNIIEIKQKLSIFQSEGKWNEGIHELMNNPLLFNSCSIDTLCISELYWLLEEKDFMHFNPSHKPKGYDKIEWNFASLFGKLVDHGIANYQNDVHFLWIVGCLIEIDCLPFLLNCHTKQIASLGEKLLERAVNLSKNCHFHELIILTKGSSDKYGLKSKCKTELFDQLAMLQLQENASDCNFSEHLRGLIENL